MKQLLNKFKNNYLTKIIILILPLLLIISSCKKSQITMPPDIVDSTIYFRSAPIWSNENEKIIFIGKIWSSELTGIYEVGYLGGLAKLLMQDSLDKKNMVLSTDGNKIAYLAAPVQLLNSSPQVYVINRDGSNKKLLTPLGGYWQNIRWSPDSKKVIFDGRVFENGELHEQIVQVDLTTEMSKQLTHGNYDNLDACFTYDGKQIAYFSYQQLYNSSGGRIFFMDEDGSNQASMDTTNEGSASPRPSPVRNEMIFSFGFNRPGIYYCNLDSNKIPISFPNRYKFYYTGGAGESDVWSPDGTIISYSYSATGITRGLNFINRDGTNDHFVINNYNVVDFCWARNSKMLILDLTPLTSLNDDHFYIYNIDSNILTKIEITFK